MKKVIVNLSLFCLFSLTACHKHADETGAYVVNIAINKPTENATVTKNTALPIDVAITRDNNATVHNVKIEIVNDKGAVVETLMEKHYHTAGKVTYTEGAYKPQTTGSFRLRVTATDDDKLQPNTKEATFSVN